jgi:RimJ/RimL family protein N-acetyltransferase
MTCKETERLLLRPPVAGDLDALQAIHEHPDVKPHINFIGVGGRVGGWRTLALLIGHWHLRGYGQWTVVEKATDDVIGRVGLWHPEGWPGLEVGWVIEPSRWGKGFATEAARAAVDFGFRDVGADHLISIIRRGNLRSVRVALKIGETFERTDSQDGHQVDVYGIRSNRQIAN